MMCYTGSAKEGFVVITAGSAHYRPSAVPLSFFQAGDGPWNDTKRGPNDYYGGIEAARGYLL